MVHYGMILKTPNARSRSCKSPGFRTQPTKGLDASSGCRAVCGWRRTSIDFVRRLNEDEQCQLGAEVIEESLDSLKSYVLDLLKPKPRRNLWTSTTSSAHAESTANRFI